LIPTLPDFANTFKDNIEDKDKISYADISAARGLSALSFRAFHLSSAEADRKKAIEFFIKGFESYTQKLILSNTPETVKNISLKEITLLEKLSRAMIADLIKDGKNAAEIQKISNLALACFTGLEKTLEGKKDLEYLKNFVKARRINFEFLTNPNLSEADFNKKLSEMKVNLQNAKAQCPDNTDLKGYIELDLAYVNQVESILAKKAISPREFITRNTASFILTVATEIDLKEGMHPDSVNKRYSALMQLIGDSLVQNPNLTFEQALQGISTSEAAHLKGLVAKTPFMKEIIQIDSTVLQAANAQAKLPQVIGSWAKQVIGKVEEYKDFSHRVDLGGNAQFYPGAYQNILRTFAPELGKPSPLSQSLKEMTGLEVEGEQVFSKQANDMLVDFHSASYGIATGFASAFNWKSFVFAGATVAATRFFNRGLLGIAGESGTLRFLVKEGELTGAGHFVSGNVTGIGFGLLGAGHQFAKESSAGNPDAMKNFVTNFVTGSFINAGAMGLTMAGSHALKPILAKTKFGTAANYAMPVVLGTGGMVGANAIHRAYLNSKNPTGPQVPLATWEEAAETAFNMAVFSTFEAAANKVLVEKQLGPYRAKELNKIAERLTDQFYGDINGAYGTEGQSATQRSQNKAQLYSRLAKDLMSGIPLKTMEGAEYQKGLAASMKISIQAPKPPETKPSGNPLPTPNITPSSDMHIGEIPDLNVANSSSKIIQAPPSEVSGPAAMTTTQGIGYSSINADGV
ncbi:MAG: hypothetical protein JNK65_03085, partial [Deltaproteobacteria bacterium]|nr:hypothetical protein [Deltaproteobacteria bacterium]